MKNNISVRLNDKKFRDHVYACWLGKNIGGTLGAPYECKREILDVKGFVTPPGKPLPNDDLDLQLIWLHAVEQHGPLNITASLLGEHWLGLIVPNWNEYGIGKGNMRRGLCPPISGDYNNSWKHSNGSWIRTEVWACMAPGCPELACKYAMEDGKVDHGAGEGTVASAFVAAMQSAAFIIKDVRKCIDLALSAVPEDSRVADSVRFAIECRDKGMEPMDVRNAVQKRNSDIGDGWFEAPSNVAYTVIGLLWGEGDFKKTVLTAINCGDDTDCTAATAGATMGILYGMECIPKDWQEYIGDEIITVSINKSHFWTGATVPKTCTELTDRVCAQAPFVLFANHAETEIGDFEDEIPENADESMRKKIAVMRGLTVFEPFASHFESDCLIADVVLDSAPDIEAQGEKTVTVHVHPHRSIGDHVINVTCRWWLPDEFTVISGKSTAAIPNKNPHDPKGIATLKFTLKAGETVATENRCVLEIFPDGYFSPLYIPILLLG